MLEKWLREAKYAVGFTGAGMSTESGLPDFRSTNKGVWRSRDTTKLTSKKALNHQVDDFIQFFQERVIEVKAYGPHQGHRIFADWERKGVIKSVITQNVDGFHQLAGSKRVAELHGTLQELHCKECGEVYDNSEYVNETYYCTCGGILRPSIVLFGESLPKDAFQFAIQETKKCDLFLVLGSSLSVSPANKLPKLAKHYGARLVIVNIDKTPLDSYADLVIRDKRIGELLMELDE